MRSKFLGLVASLVAFVVSGVVGFALGLRFYAPPELAMAPVVLPEETHEHPMSDVAERVAALERRMSERERVGVEASAATPAETAAASPDSPRRAALGPEEHVAYVASLADTETADRRWEAEVADTVMQRSAEFPEDVALERIRCGTELCLVEFEHRNSESHMSVLTALVEDIGPGFGGRAVMQRQELSGEEGFVTRLYLARPGQMLPRPPISPGGT